jgi:hypothetical protein
MNGTFINNITKNHITWWEKALRDVGKIVTTTSWKCEGTWDIALQFGDMLLSDRFTQIASLIKERSSIQSSAGNIPVKAMVV